MEKDIKALILDVDGTLTDGKIYTSANGEFMKAFNIKDGYGLVILPKYGITPVIITGRSSEIVKKRCEELGITEVYQGVHNKSYQLREVCKKLDIALDQCAYIGDDVNDLPAMKLCGVTACPSDAMKQVRDVVDIVMEAKGGEGAVRELCDYLIEHSSAYIRKDIQDFEFTEVVFENEESMLH